MTTDVAAKVLLLDDEPLILRAVRRSLLTLGLDVVMTTDAAEARAIVAREPPDVVVSDLHMPDACGASFLEEVSSAAPGAVRILLSADTSFRPKVGSLRAAGVHALVGKAQMTSLADVVRAHLDARAATPGNEAETAALATTFARALARPTHEDDCHRERTARLAETLAAAVGASASERFDARLCALLHDVGQVAVPEHVFRKPASLAPDERQELERHPIEGARILAEIDAFRRAASAVLAHHERQDGAGYPTRAAGPAIPAAARLFQVADAFDAISRGRPYAPARTRAEAIAEVARSAGTQLDADVVRAFLSLDPDALAV